jgi:hypothetical protein
MLGGHAHVLGGAQGGGLWIDLIGWHGVGGACWCGLDLLCLLPCWRWGRQAIKSIPEGFEDKVAVCGQVGYRDGRCLTDRHLCIQLVHENRLGSGKSGR